MAGVLLGPTLLGRTVFAWDHPRPRLQPVADTYGLDAGSRAQLMQMLADSIELRRNVERDG